MCRIYLRGSNEIASQEVLRFALISEEKGSKIFNLLETSYYLVVEIISFFIIITKLFAERPVKKISFQLHILHCERQI